MQALRKDIVVTASGIAASAFLMTATAGVPEDASVMGSHIPFAIATSGTAETAPARTPGDPDCPCKASIPSYCRDTGNGPYFPMGHDIDSYLHLCRSEIGFDR